MNGLAMNADEYQSLFVPANRIDEACYVQGEEDEHVIEFFLIFGSVVQRRAASL